MNTSKIRLLVRCEAQPRANCRVALEQVMGTSEPRMRLASLVSDSAGYVSFSMTPTYRQDLPQPGELPLGALRVRVDGEDLLEDRLEYLFGLPPDFRVRDLGRRHAILALHAAKDAERAGLRADPEKGHACGCAGTPEGTAVEDPDRHDYEVSPTSFVDRHCVRLGDQDCERPAPMTGAISSVDIWRVVDLGDPEQDDEPLQAPALVDPAAAPTVETGLRWGLLERFRQTWTPLGHSLGDIVYSLALAPGESTQLAVIEWSREDVGRRDDTIDSSEKLEHDQRADRSIKEVTRAALREDQGGGSFESGLSASIPIKGVQLNVGLGGGVTHSWGRRDLSAEAKQDLHQRVTQQSQIQRQKTSTVIVQGRAREDNRLAVRAVANHNHCHALTVQYFEVLRHLALETHFVQRECAVLVPHALLDFDRAAVQRWRHLLAPAALDTAAEEGFAALERLLSGRTSATGGAKTGAGGQGTNPATGKPLHVLRITLNSSTARSRKLEGSLATIGLRLKNAPGVLKSLRVHQAGMATVAFGFPPTPPTQVLSAEMKEQTPMEWSGVSIDLLKSIQLSWSPAGTPSGQELWTVQDIRVEATDGSTWYTLLDKREDIEFEAVSAGSSVREFEFSGPEPAPTPGTQPEVDDAQAIEHLIEHVAAHTAHYSRAVWLGMDDSARRMQLAHSFGHAVADGIDGPPLAVSGNHVAFRWRMPAPPWLQTLINQFNEAPAALPEESIVYLPTRGVFAEAMLGHCNACEKRDITRMWDWTEATVEPLPSLTGLSPGAKGSTVIPQEPQLPGPVLNIQAAPALPDFAGLSSTLSGLTQGGIFRDMSGLGDVTSLLKTLSNNASLDLQTRQKAAEAAARMESSGPAGGRSVAASSPKDQFDRLTVAKEVQAVGDALGWTAETTDAAVRDALSGGGRLGPIPVDWLLGAVPGTTPWSAWPRLRRSEVVDRIAKLRDNPNLFNQGALGLCTAAAFYHHIIQKNPTMFALFANALYVHGDAFLGRLRVKPGDAVRSVDYPALARTHTLMPPAADWMLMAALRDSTNWLFDFEGSPDETYALETTIQEMREWYEATGAYSSVSSSIIRGKAGFLGLSKTPRNHLALWVRLSLIGDPRPDTHIITVESPITVDTAANRVSFDYWTWGGAVRNLTADLNLVDASYLGAVVAEF